MDATSDLLDTAKDVLGKAQGAIEPLTAKAGAVYSTYSGQAADLCAADPTCSLVTPQLAGAPFEELVLLALTILPLLSLLFTLLTMFVNFIFCCKSSKVAPEAADTSRQFRSGAPQVAPARVQAGAGAPTPSSGGARPPPSSGGPAPAMQSRNSVVQRGKPGAPEGSIGHPTRAQGVKNPPKSGGKPGAGAYMA